MRAADAIAAEHFGLVEGLLRQTRLHRHHMADEFRSKAGEAFARAALGPAAALADPRAYLARAVLNAFGQVRRRYRVRGRRWACLDAAVEAGFEPAGREPAPDFMAELRESLDVGAAGSGRLRAVPQKTRLSPDHRALLASLIRANPGLNDTAVRREFVARARVEVALPTVRYYRAKTGVPNPDAGTDWARRRGRGAG